MATDVRLEPITEANLKAVFGLETGPGPGRLRRAAIPWSLAQALVEGDKAWPRAIVARRRGRRLPDAGDRPGRCGRPAVLALAADARRRPPAPAGSGAVGASGWRSTRSAPVAARSSTRAGSRAMARRVPFYERLGFVPTGELDEDEIVARLILSPRGRTRLRLASRARRSDRRSAARGTIRHRPSRTGSGPVRLSAEGSGEAGRGSREPRLAVRGHPAQHRLDGRRPAGGSRRLGRPRAPARRVDRRRRALPRPRPDPRQAADLHERVGARRPQGPRARPRAAGGPPRRRPTTSPCRSASCASARAAATAATTACARSSTSSSRRSSAGSGSGSASRAARSSTTS